MVRSVSVSERGSITPTPTQWDSQTVRPPSFDSNNRHRDRDDRSRNGSRNGRESAAGHHREGRDRDGRERDGQERDRYAQSNGANHHHRSDSEAAGSNGYPETAQSGPSRRHDYDVQSMETNVVSPRSSRNPIPPPLVSIRSEFPTLNRSRTQQTLACLITVEVPDNNWRPDPEDVRGPPLPKVREEERYVRPPSPVKSVKQRFYPYESPEVLEEMTESLRGRVENWHSLDFQR